MNIKSLFLYRKQNCSYISQKLDFERFSRQRKKWLLGCFSLPQSERISFWKYSAIWNTDYLRQGLKRSFSKGFTSEIWAQKKKNYDASTFVYMLPVFYWKLATIFDPTCRILQGIDISISRDWQNVTGFGQLYRNELKQEISSHSICQTLQLIKNCKLG